MPEEGGRDADGGRVGRAGGESGESRGRADDFVIAGEDQAAGEVSVSRKSARRTRPQSASDALELFARLDEQVAGRKLDRDPLASIARPNVQAGKARATVNGQEVQVCSTESQRWGNEPTIS